MSKRGKKKRLLKKLRKREIEGKGELETPKVNGVAEVAVEEDVHAEAQETDSEMHSASFEYGIQESLKLGEAEVPETREGESVEDGSSIESTEIEEEESPTMSGSDETEVEHQDASEEEKVSEAVEASENLSSIPLVGEEEYDPNRDYSTEPLGARIRVVGIGGGGGNAVNNMIRSGLTGVEFLFCRQYRSPSLTIFRSHGKNSTW